MQIAVNLIEAPSDVGGSAARFRILDFDICNQWRRRMLRGYHILSRMSEETPHTRSRDGQQQRLDCDVLRWHDSRFVAEELFDLRPHRETVEESLDSDKPNI